MILLIFKTHFHKICQRKLRVNISQFITEERPYFEHTEAIVSMTDDELIKPDKTDSTELGEVPQASEQGSIRKGYIRDPYALNYLYTME